MSSTRKEILYFETTGEGNTGEVFALAKERATELGVKDIVVASTRGDTGVKASEFLRGFNVVVVTHFTGFREPGEQQMSPENRRTIERNGAVVLTCGHPFMGVGRAIRGKFDTVSSNEIVAQTLRLFSQGTKVAVEITLMAADAGLISSDKEVIAIAGTGKGADTALVLWPANSSRLFDLKVREIIALPRG